MSESDKEMSEEEFLRRYQEITSSPKFREGVHNWTRDILVTLLSLWLITALFIKYH